jgi:pyridoxine 5-phosphate synthase
MPVAYIAPLRLGVNIDHVATLRNARGGMHPDPVRAALQAIEAGADGITAHLREDRRHIRDEDMRHLKRVISKPLNFEMAATDEMVKLALDIKPHAVCLVPEKREERTTEGGLDVRGSAQHLRPLIQKLKDASIRVSLFVEPDPVIMEAAKDLGAAVVELHTGSYADSFETGDKDAIQRQLKRLQDAAFYGAELQLEIHAGHGLTYNNVGAIAAIKPIVELNIGHFLMGEAVFAGLTQAVQDMRKRMDSARRGA